MADIELDDFYKPPDMVGELLRYDFLDRLGQGSFGITWLALDKNLNRNVAIKQFHPAWFWSQIGGNGFDDASPDAQIRYSQGLDGFLAEARLLAGLNHPNCVQVYDVVEQSGTGYMIMAYEQGKSLKRLYRTNDIDNEAAYLKLLMPILDALEFLHNHSIIHADIKSDNIVIRADGNPVLLDFGSTRTHTVPYSAKSGENEIDGYEEPDQARTKEGHYGPWTDIFALGRTLYTGVNCGIFPPNSDTRRQALNNGHPDPLESAYRIGRGRYTERFLRAIDAALFLNLDLLPVDIAAWRKLFPEPDIHAPEHDPSHCQHAIDVAIASELLSQDETRIRIAALKIPSEQMPDYFAWLVDELSSAHVVRRLGALTSLFELKHPELEQWLIRLAAEKRWSVRRKAIFYLGEIRSQVAIPLLSALMSDGDAGIRVESRDAMKKISGDT